MQSEDILKSLGATETDIPKLLEYTKNAFSRVSDEVRNLPENDTLLKFFNDIVNVTKTDGVATAINDLLLAKGISKIAFEQPETLNIYPHTISVGRIIIIETGNVSDFEKIVKYAVYKGKEVPNIHEIGAMFANGKFKRFIILSDKPYSNVTAQRMGLSETEWKAKSLILRREHESTHYFTKKFYGSAKNNLHDELIADFFGLWGAFGSYKSEWFLKFLGLSEDSDGIYGRIKVYTNGMSDTAVSVIEKIAIRASEFLEKWSKSSEFSVLNNEQRISYLCEKNLLEIK